ncbi:MAG: endonuclease/exonuclease/phosphatase family protein [Chlorobi bacterium]|nr:endonuclease/exonuclease/phosphatase family protein [Chlorobiota bacterium]
MKITIGTFNLNNLFSRYNFKASIKSLKKGGTVVEYVFEDEENFKIRKFQGKLIKPKNQKDTEKIAARILEMGADILAVQEVEDINILKKFNKDFLGSKAYKYVTLIEGNDPRFIDVGLLSNYPLGGITSWQHAVYDNETREIFSRDLLQAEILNEKRTKTLFTLFVTHLKSNFISYTSPDADKQRVKNNQKRLKQSEVIGRIIEDQTRPDSKYILVGDMNDSADSLFLKGFSDYTGINLHNALENMQETGKMNKTKYPPGNIFWTHRYRVSTGNYAYNLYDQIWISPALTGKLTGSWVARRKSVTGDGSDHDPVWIELNL